MSDTPSGPDIRLTSYHQGLYCIDRLAKTTCCVTFKAVCLQQTHNNLTASTHALQYTDQATPTTSRERLEPTEAYLVTSICRRQNQLETPRQCHAYPHPGSTRRTPALSPAPPNELSTPVMDGEDIDALTQRLMKPTRASQAKTSLHWKMDTYLDRGRHAWSKMELCEDNKKCLWTSNGTVKKTYQT
ncbi:uncharacterized protein LOC124254656 [Haliotis rubra]|uniref:uncharacterized protein LOC124254656 n=1 Tax=Haliotis rubra TaxID=36100 RepID=UPI001EE5AC41|nr:uncharacterized protein LOC124254656 [Haliotis rubra]